MNNPREDGWEESGQGNGTYTNKNRDERVMFEKGDTGTTYIKNVGGSYSGWEPYDSEKHGTSNK